MRARRLSTAGLLVAASLALPLTALPAPHPQKSASATAHSSGELRTIVGTVVEKGAVLRCEADQKLYKILNSETLRHLEGQYVALKVRFLEAKGVYYVTAVRASRDAADPVKLDDVAFRR